MRELIDQEFSTQKHLVSITVEHAHAHSGLKFLSGYVIRHEGIVTFSGSYDGWTFYYVHNGRLYSRFLNVKAKELTEEDVRKAVKRFVNDVFLKYDLRIADLTRGRK